jgi:hypothetical protein
VRAERCNDDKLMAAAVERRDSPLTVNINGLGVSAKVRSINGHAVG